MSEFFDRKLSWKFNLHVVAWVGLQSKNEGLRKWLIMQCIKRSSTLRVTSKGDKPSPRVVYQHGSQDQAIKDFLDFRQLIKQIHKEVK